MNADIYDTYATAVDGTTIHFDVLVPAGAEADTAFEYARQWLTSVGLQDADLKQSRCRFCHAEAASDEVRDDIQNDGFHIIRMEGCPE